MQPSIYVKLIGSPIFAVSRTLDEGMLTLIYVLSQHQGQHTWVCKNRLSLHTSSIFMDCGCYTQNSLIIELHFFFPNLE